MTYYSAMGIIEKKYVCEHISKMTFIPTDIIIQNCNHIIEVVASYFNVPICLVKKKHGRGIVALTRQISSTIITERYPYMAYRRIAELYGNAYIGANGKADHASVIHNRNKVKGWIEVNDPIVKDITNIKILL